MLQEYIFERSILFEILSQIDLISENRLQLSIIEKIFPIKNKMGKI